MKQTARYITETLAPVYGQAEASEMAWWILEELTGHTRADALCGYVLEEKVCKDNTFSSHLQTILQRLAKKEPLQYVFGHTLWNGLDLQVNSSTLIPRPETAMLVDLCKNIRPNQPTHVLDIGTGSGCIALSVKKNHPEWQVEACDISEDALHTAAENARRNSADVRFFSCDILKDVPEGVYDLIVSNPPYICEEEKTSMESNVLDYEPHSALFVPDTDPLLFYRRITRLAADRLLTHGGHLLFEINERFGQETKEMMEQLGFCDVAIHKDMYEKDRIVCGKKQ